MTNWHKWIIKTNDVVKYIKPKDTKLNYSNSFENKKKITYNFKKLKNKIKLQFIK